MSKGVNELGHERVSELVSEHLQMGWAGGVFALGGGERRKQEWEITW